METSGSTSIIPKRKRKRLNFACNHCRERKIRCDEGKPSCHSCLATGVPCVTTDKRRPGAEVERKTAGSPRLQSSTARQQEPTTDKYESPLRGPACPSPGFQSQSKRVRTLSPALSIYSDDTDHLTPVSATAVDADDVAPLQITIDPPAEDASGRYGGLLPLVPRLRGVNTLETFTAWLDLAFYRLGVRRQVKADPQGNPQTEKVPPIATPSLLLAPPALPTPDVCHAAVQRYFSTINLIYPLLDLPTVQGLVESASKPGAEALLSRDFASILQLRLVLVLGSTDGSSGLNSVEAAQHMSHCQSILGHLLSTRSLEAVKSVFMLAVALSKRDEVASSWHVTTLCVSMAQSIGLHRRRRPSRQDPSPVDEKDEEQRRRVWWSIFSFEKLFAFEFGRPSSIRDSDCDQAEPSYPPLSTKGGWSFRIMTSFSRLLSQINEAGIRYQLREERASQGSLEGVLRHKTKLIGKSMYLLMQWAETVPERLRPRFDLICSRDEFPLASFISIHYNNALMLLSRNSFLVSNEAIKKTVEMYTIDKPWSSVMENGPTAAANSARTIIKQLVDGEEMGAAPVISTLAPPLHAVYVLAIHLLANPGSKLASWDLDLLQHGAEFAEKLYKEHHADQQMHMVLGSLKDQISAVVRGGKQKCYPRQTNSSLPRETTIADRRLPLDESTAFGSSHGIVQPNQMPNVPTIDPLRTDALDMGGGSTINGDIREMLWPVDTPSDMGWGWDDFGQVFDLSFGGSAPT